MVIGTAAAIIGGSLIAAGGTAIASKNSSNASKAASQATTQAADKNNALQREIYGNNAARLDPYAQRGNAAATSIDALLSGGAGADDAFARFREGSGYNFIRDEALNAVTGGFAGKSVGQSGAAYKALQDRAGQIGSAVGFQPFLNALQVQQETGLRGASALAGVGQNFAGAVGNNNNSAASATGNAALANAYNTNNAIGQGVGTFTNLLGSSFGGGGGGFNAGAALSGAQMLPQFATPGIGFAGGGVFPGGGTF
jgi:hypothetical protein